jgi:pimeloyl-ACP methyl ester carboxylesterase
MKAQAHVESTRTELVNGRRIAVAEHREGPDTVVFCHGFRGTSTGPQRLFVHAARLLADRGISSIRFDQFGSGNSEGDYLQSSFDDWCATIRSLAESRLGEGRRVALFGQSMGASAAIVVSSWLPALSALVAWVPDPNVDPLKAGPLDVIEEGGELVRGQYWIEARQACVAKRLTEVDCPAYIVQCTSDAFVDRENRAAIEDSAQPQHRIDTYEGRSHSAWSFNDAQSIVVRSVDFLADTFRSSNPTEVVHDSGR